MHIMFTLWFTEQQCQKPLQKQSEGKSAFESESVAVTEVKINTVLNNQHCKSTTLGSNLVATRSRKT